MSITVTTHTDTITYAYDPGHADAVLAYYEGLKATGKILAYEVD
jgi:hypothetical protein